MSDDDADVDRQALDSFPRDIEPTADWLRCWTNVLLAGPSEYADDPAQLEPGLRVLAEIVGGEMEEATSHLAWVQTVLTEDPRTVIARRLAPGISLADATKVKVDVTRQARQVLRAQLRDVIDTAQLLKVPAREVASLLTDVIREQAHPASPIPHPSEQPQVTLPAGQKAATPASNVLAFDRDRDRQPAAREDGPPHSQG